MADQSDAILCSGLLRLRASIVAPATRTTDPGRLHDHFGFDAAPGVAIAGNHDLPFDVHASLGQHFIVGGQSIVDLNQRRRHFAIDGGGVIDGRLILAKAGCLIFCNRRLFQFGHKAPRLCPHANAG